MELIGLCICLTIYFCLRYYLDFVNEQRAREDYYKHGPEQDQTDDPDWWKRSDN